MRIYKSGHRIGKIGQMGWGLLIFLVGLTVSSWAEDYRSFISNDGQSIKGRILKFDANQGTIYFERDNQVQMWVSPSIFCAEDQGFIREWIHADLFLSESKLILSINKSESRKTGSKEKLLKQEIFYFDLMIRNGAGVPFNSLKVEYCYYIDSVISNRNSSKTICEKLDPIILGSLEAVKLQTEDVILSETYINRVETRITHDRYNKITGTEETTYYDPIRTDKFKGVWVRIYGPSVDGVPSVRHLCIPSNLMDEVKWGAYVEEKIAISKEDEVQQLLSAIKARGKAKSEAELLSWYREVDNTIPSKNSGKEQIVFASSIIEGFYVARFDPTGVISMSFAKTCSYYHVFDCAIYWYNKSIEAGRLSAHFHLAELYSSAPDKMVQNGPKAVEYALLAIDKEKRDPKLLDLLARAYARNEQFDLAVQYEKQAIERLLKTTRNSKQLTNFQQRLDLFNNKKPYTTK